MSHEIIFFGAFALFIILMLAIDLGLFHKKDQPVSLAQAGIMSAVWVAFALCFYFFFESRRSAVTQYPKPRAIIRHCF